jgi:hypothetical protein
LPFEYIEKEGNELMAALEKKVSGGSGKAAFVARVSHYYCEINMLHPFCAVTVLPSAFSLSSWRSTRATAGLARYRSGPLGGG